MAAPSGDQGAEHLSVSPPSVQGKRLISPCQSDYAHEEQVEDCNSSFTKSASSSHCSSPPSSLSSQVLSYPTKIVDFWKCGLRGEWAYGKFVPMPPPTPEHEDRAFYVVYLFWEFLQKLDPSLDYQPERRMDVGMVSGTHHRWCDVVYLKDKNPIIAFEIVSSSDDARKVDLVDKKDEYARIRIPAFVLIDGEDKNGHKVVVHSNPVDGQYTTTQEFKGTEEVKGHELLEYLNVQAMDFLEPAMTRRRFMSQSKQNGEKVDELDTRLENSKKELEELRGMAEKEKEKRVAAEQEVEAEKERRVAAEQEVESENKKRVAAEQEVESENKKRVAAEQENEETSKRLAEVEAELAKLKKMKTG